MFPRLLQFGRQNRKIVTTRKKKDFSGSATIHSEWTHLFDIPAKSVSHVMPYDVCYLPPLSLWLADDVLCVQHLGRPSAADAIIAGSGRCVH